ncbi:MAG: dihydroneopterin aldolase [Acidiferrobacterales bacterium]
MDIIYLRDLKVPCTIGVREWERRIKQTVYIDLELAVDLKPAAASDRLEDALDYKSVSKHVTELVSNSQFRLVETLAEKIAETVLAEFRVPWVRVRINKKGALRAASDVGVVIERGQR